MCKCKRGPRGYRGLSYLDDLTYTEVAISSAQILAMGNVPVELLPQPGANKYYDIDKIILEFKDNGTPFSTGANSLINIEPNYSKAAIDILNSGENSMAILKTSMNENTGGVYTLNTFLNEAITMSTQEDMIDGNGTILAKIRYKVRTFGTEL